MGPELCFRRFQGEKNSLPLPKIERHFPPSRYWISPQFAHNDKHRAQAANSDTDTSL
jgi:hypothetical protein